MSKHTVMAWDERHILVEHVLRTWAEIITLYAGREKRAITERDKWFGKAGALTTENSRLQDATQDLTAQRDAARAELAALRDIVLWALGESGAFPLRPEGKGIYYWRGEMRRRLNAIDNGTALREKSAAEPRTNDSGVRQALSKLQRRCDAYKDMIDHVAAKNGGLRHKIKSLQSYISRLKQSASVGQLEAHPGSNGTNAGSSPAAGSWRQEQQDARPGPNGEAAGSSPAAPTIFPEPRTVPFSELPVGAVFMFEEPVRRKSSIDRSARLDGSEEIIHSWWPLRPCVIVAPPAAEPKPEPSEWRAKLNGCIDILNDDREVRRAIVSALLWCRDGIDEALRLRGAP